MSSGPKSTSTLTDSQKLLVNNLVHQMMGGKGEGGGLLAKGATAYKGVLTAPYIDKNTGAEQSALRSLLSGKPSYDLDPEITKQRFQDTVVNPAMNVYNTRIAPSIKEGYAGGGAAFNSRSGDQQNRTLNDMNVGFSSQLADMLYKNQALAAQLSDTAAGRQATGVQLASSIAGQNWQFAQNGLNNKRSEFMRTAPENNPWVQTALALTGQSQMALYNKPSPLPAIGGAVGMGIGTMFGPVGTIVGGAAGTAVGQGVAAM